MDKKSFDEQLIKPIERWSHLGEQTNKMGNRLVGHVPHIAPKAYLHVIFAPSDSEEFEELEDRLGRPVPEQLNQFLGLANGLSFFTGSINVEGFVPYQRKFGVHPHNYPGNIVVRNSTARIKGLHEATVVMAFYKWDGSYASIEPDGSVVRFDAQGHGGALQTWPDFDSWITSEIAYFSQFFDEEGKMKGDGKEIFAPH